jgi:hypothetical protein
MQAVCSPACAMSLVATKKAKAAISAMTADRKETRAKLEKLKTRAVWAKEAQAAFNRYIRLRDAGDACICCGGDMGSGTFGGDVDAGHYRSRGSAPHLRFDERNVHAQRKQCNRYGSGNVVGYRVGLIAKIGLKAVEELESDQTPRNHTIDDLKAIKSKYTAMARELERLNG